MCFIISKVNKTPREIHTKPGCLLPLDFDQFGDRIRTVALGEDGC